MSFSSPSHIRSSLLASRSPSPSRYLGDSDSTTHTHNELLHASDISSGSNVDRTLLLDSFGWVEDIVTTQSQEPESGYTQDISEETACGRVAIDTSAASDENGSQTEGDIDDCQPRNDGDSDHSDFDGTNNFNTESTISSTPNDTFSTPATEASPPPSPPHTPPGPNKSFLALANACFTALLSLHRLTTFNNLGISAPVPAPVPATSCSWITLFTGKCSTPTAPIIHNTERLEPSQQATQRPIHTSTARRPIALTPLIARCYAHRQLIEAARSGVAVYKTGHQMKAIVKTTIKEVKPTFEVFRPGRPLNSDASFVPFVDLPIRYRLLKKVWRGIGKAFASVSTEEGRNPDGYDWARKLARKKPVGCWRGSGSRRHNGGMFGRGICGIGGLGVGRGGWGGEGRVVWIAIGTGGWMSEEW